MPNTDVIEGTIRLAQDIGRLVRSRRKQAGLTQARLAVLAGVGTRFLSELERGKPGLRLDKVLMVLQDLGFEIGVRAAGPVRIVGKESQAGSLLFWLGRPEEERIAAVEAVRRASYALAGLKKVPRLVKEVSVVERHPS